MSRSALLRRPAHVLLGSLCAGLAAANAARVGWSALAAAAAVGCVLLCGRGALDGPRLVVAAGAIALAGWWWGSLRLAAVDRSPLTSEIGRAARVVAAVTAPPRRGRFSIRAPADVRRFEGRVVREPVLLELPLGRAPPQGAIVELVAQVVEPRSPSDGFDERTYLRRHGIHVVLRGGRWRQIGRRTGLGAVADRLHGAVDRALRDGASGERQALLLGVVLGDDGEIGDELKERFQASGLYHLLAVSGQNVAFVAGAVLLAAWLLGLSRGFAEVGALAAIGAYVLAVGPQPSVVRAGVAGALGSLAWLAARERDRWYFLGLGALVLLAWNPYTLLDVGFQLSFAAVIAIFLVAPRLERVLEGYPMPKPLRSVVAISTACGLVTAPILLLQFGSVPLLSVPANAAAAPAMAPLLALALGGAVVHPVAPGVSAILVQVAGWFAWYLAGCARVVGGLPAAQARAGWTLLALSAFCAAAVVGTRGRRRRSRPVSLPSWPTS